VTYKLWLTQDWPSKIDNVPNSMAAIIGANRRNLIDVSTFPDGETLVLISAGTTCSCHQL
jgi:hypothetical protein